MKHLIIRFVLPLSLIFFLLFTQWRLVETDLALSYLYGFPLPYSAPCIAGDGCTQYFLMPLGVDLLVYFLTVLVFTWLIYYFHRLRIPAAIGYLLWAINVLYYVPSVAYKNSGKQSEFYWQHDYSIFRVVASGYLFIWEEDPVVDYSKYHPAEKSNRPE